VSDNVTITDIDILKPGTYWDASGNKVVVTAADVAELAAAYEPELQDAPAVVGHPKINHPAYGWMRNLRVDGDVLLCDLVDVDPEFADTIKAKRYKNRSLAYFGRTSKGNPKPGKLYPKHLGWLGAKAPAVKGLKEIALSADDEAIVIELASPSWSWRLNYALRTIADTFRRQREAAIADGGVDAGDRLIPAFVIDELTSAANQIDADIAAEADTASAHFASPDNQGGQMATPEEIAAREAALAQKEATLAAREKSIGDKEVALAAAETTARRKDDAELVDKLIGEGRLRPTEKNDVLAELAALDDVDTTIELSSPDGAKVTLTPRDALRRRLSASPKLVALGAHPDKGGPGADGIIEFAAPDGMSVDADRLALHQRALAYQTAHPNTDYIAAVRAVSKP
jgi:hypothetical protein